MNKLFEKSSKLRNLRQQVVGIEKIKDDPFANDRLELEQYESVVRTTKAAVDKFSATLAELNGVHAEMMDATKKFHEFNENITQKKRIEVIDAAFDSIDSAYPKCSENIELVSHKLDSLLAMHAGLSARLVERDKSHAAKAHYETKIQALQASEKDPEKIERNLKKQQEAQAEFDKTEDLTIRECRDALNTRWKDLDQVLGLYVRGLSTYFGGINQRFSALDDFTNEMVHSHVREIQEEFHEPVAAEAPKIEAARSAVMQHNEAADAEHNALRTALGLRLKGKGPELETKPTKVLEDSDNESDLFTPPSRVGP